MRTQEEMTVPSSISGQKAPNLSGDEKIYIIIKLSIVPWSVHIITKVFYLTLTNFAPLTVKRGFFSPFLI